MRSERLHKLYRVLVDNLYVKPRFILDLILHPSRTWNHPSFYPELPRKSNGRIWLDQLQQTLRYGYPENYYFPYGFDVKSSEEIRGYLHFEGFAHLRDRLNSKKKLSQSYFARQNTLWDLCGAFRSSDAPQLWGVAPGGNF